LHALALLGSAASAAVDRREPRCAAETVQGNGIPRACRRQKP